ncbi:MAG: hypothetical protein KDK36_12555, partial [Leptospiraceae bacterium]|nr:hypothetical protein [Leptospiraceae bacterium]
YYDSLENYKFIQYSKPSEKLTWEINESKYEIIISGVKRKSWNSSFKHWMKYFIRTFRSSNKYHWITLLYFQLLGVWAFGLFVYFNYRKSQN